MTHRFFMLLNRKPLRWVTPDPVYFFLLDRLTNNNGWRPLGYREGK